MAKKVTTPESVKMDKQDVEKFNQFQNQINMLVRSLGELTFELSNLTNQKEQTIKKIEQVRSESQKHLKEFEEKNGPGTIDLEKGLFAPANSE